MTPEALVAIIFFVTFLFVGIVAWSIIGLLVVLYHDLFGRRYDYDKDYEFTKAEIWMAGPIVWWLERQKRR